VKPRTSRPQQHIDAAPNGEAIAELAKFGGFMPGGGWGQGDPHAGLPAPVLNFEELKRAYRGS
jgi:hypothetical protein